MQKFIFIICLFCSAGVALAQVHTPGNTADSAKIIWKQIAPFFEAPAAHKNDLGHYRSPLRFYDGSMVRTPADWKKRRAEILDQWTSMLGKWPPLLKNQQLKILESIKKDGFTQHKVSFKWLPEEETIGYLLVPEGNGKFPAVVTTFYEPETAAGLGTSERTRTKADFAYQLVKRGFVALSIGTTDATKALTYSLYYPSIEKAEVQPLSMLAYAAANAWHVLANQPQVDSSRIGVLGFSFGGKWSMFAACLYEKFACGAWSDAGIVFDEKRPNVNYWEPWYLGYHPKPWRPRGVITDSNHVYGLYPRLVKEGYDLHELHALMAPRPFFVSGGAEDSVDRWQALNHSVAVNRLLGFKDRVAMTNDRIEHLPTPLSNERMYQFFEYFLKYNAAAQPKPAGARRNEKNNKEK
ncbi:MAG: sialidase [Chitinophagaceae bacterium]|nr:MAG: sialidase [Chitinophagaceae bacterium]